MALNLASLIDTSTRYFATDTALKHDARALSYVELQSHVRGFASYLREKGLRKGDRVALMMPNCTSFTVAYFGILYAGGVVVPVSYLSVDREIAYALKDSNAVFLVASHAYESQTTSGFNDTPDCRELFLVDDNNGPVSMVNAAPCQPTADFGCTQTEADDVAVILYTSGTTGAPKGASLTHFNLFSNAQFSCDRMFWKPREKCETLGPGHVVLAALPLFHSFGQTCNQNAALLGGACLTYLERFEPEQALEVMQRDRVTLFTGVPTMYFQLLNFEGHARFDLECLRFSVSGGAALPVQVLREFDARYPVKILEGYGLSETSPVATFNSLFRPRKPGSIGQAIPGVDVRVFDSDDNEVDVDEIGEVVIRGPNVMKEYHGRPEATAEAFRSGWFHSGDMARRDDEGFFYIVDRKKDMIIRGGFNIYPREVEDVLYTHPAVREAAVIGTPSDEYGEEVTAYVSLKPGSAEAIDSEAIIEFARKHLASHKYPRMIHVINDLPKGPTQKILRKELREK
jgi:long-chain acyl-CoA synthetase